ncbi:MAG: hypothetical protein NT016_03750 [Candidatus Aenigmarchaeota archaeon]|nr:hypothetical protein [Candidatus Aenigmarchaeota archaeon]
MGSGGCRFKGCEERSSVDYIVGMPEYGLNLQVCGMWKHYAQAHNVHPYKELRSAVMGDADADPAALRRINGASYHIEGGMPGCINAFFVERAHPFGRRWNYRIGGAPDAPFVSRMQQLIDERGQEIMYGRY